MAYLAAAAPYIAIAGTVLDADAKRRAGEIDKMNADFEAAQLERNADAAAAESQREAIKARREARYMESRVRAVAAAGGGAADDPTVVRLIDGIAEEGEYNALSALYNGSSRAQTMQLAAASTRGQGKASQQAGNVNAMSTALQGAGQFARNSDLSKSRKSSTVLNSGSTMARYG